MNKKIAITGGIGSGKSLVLNCLKELGYPTYSCDEIYKEIRNSKAYLESIENLFPDCVEGGILNTEKLAKEVFSNPISLQKLNCLSHPLIMDTLLRCMEAEKAKLVFAEVPLLFEGNHEGLFHETIYVKRNLEKRIEAIIQRDNLSRESILNRINNQFDCESEDGKTRLHVCHAHIIENDGDIEDLKKQLINILDSF